MLNWAVALKYPRASQKVGNMAKRSTRNKLRVQCHEAQGSLKKAQRHLTYLASLGVDGSPYIDEHLPVIMTYLDIIIKGVDRFEELL